MFIVHSDNFNDIHLVFIINFVVLDEIMSSHSISFDYLLSGEDYLSPFSFLFIAMLHQFHRSDRQSSQRR